MRVASTASTRCRSHPSCQAYKSCSDEVVSLARNPPSRLALWVGDVDAPDEPSAIEEAIKIYNITNPEHQKHLAVRRIKYLGSLGSGE